MVKVFTSETVVQGLILTRRNWLGLKWSSRAISLILDILMHLLFFMSSFSVEFVVESYDADLCHNL